MAIVGTETDIILVTEVIPKAQVLPIAPALLEVPGFVCFPSFDLNESNLGAKGSRGICAYVRLGIHATEIHFTASQFREQIWLQIKLRGSDRLLVGCIYRSPSGDPHLSVQALAELFHIVRASNPSHLVIAGDFNLPQIDWSLPFCPAPDTHYAHRFLTAVQDCLLFQHVTCPTRYRDGFLPSVLDLVLTNEEGMLTNLEYLPSLGKSDHVVLAFQVACYTSQANPEQVKLNFHRADFLAMNQRLAETDWSQLQSVDVEQGYQIFKETLGSIVSNCVPPAKDSRSRKSIYMNAKALRLRRLKNSLWQRYRGSDDPLDAARFRLCRNRLRRLTRQLRRDFETQLVRDVKSNPKAFWRYSNSRLKTKPRIGDLRDASGGIESEAGGKANLLNTFFASVFTREDRVGQPSLSTRAITSHLSDILISPDAVAGKLLSLSPSSAPGPDDLHPRILREASQSLAVPLAHLFRRSLDTGRVPRDWTLARVVPILKKGDKLNPNNYRPISLTAIPCKVLEALIRDQLLCHLTEQGLLSDDQHGFRPRRSCSTQLLHFLEAVSTELEHANPVDVLYMDFQKAFDSVPHQRLLHKLRSYGVSGCLLAWIEAFLTERWQQVVLEGCHSEWSAVLSGVPQGSVLGPLLFLVYVNDLPDTVHSGVKMFADDTKLYSHVSPPAGGVQLQADLDALNRWSNTWLMPFNLSKCKVLHLGRANPGLEYTMSGAMLDSTPLEKDLGVLVDADLKFREQASSAVAKATQILAVIRRSFALIDEVTLPLLFTTLVRPHLEYGNLVWGPFNRADQRLVERVQRRATRMVESVRAKPYEDRLRLLQLPSLHYRRRRGDMVHTYQLFHGGVDASPSDFFTLTEGQTRGHPFKVYKPPASTRPRRFCYAVRSVNDWNGLPAEVVCAPSLNAFKARLDAHWAHFRYKVPDTD